MESDTSFALSEWGETLTVLRDAPSYSGGGGMASHSWAGAGTILGDWQPVDGKTVMMEAKMTVKSESLVICAVDVDVLANDRLQRADGTYMYVNYIRKHEDHWTIYLKRAT